MTINELTVASKEQTIPIGEDYLVEIVFDMIYKRWFYNLYRGAEIVYAGIALVPDSYGLLNISLNGIMILDVAKDKEDYEPCNELGSRLALMEVTE